MIKAILPFFVAPPRRPAARSQVESDLKRSLADLSLYIKPSRKPGSRGGSSCSIRQPAPSRALLRPGEHRGKKPVDADTIYHWASITKDVHRHRHHAAPGRGLLRLEDPIIKYVPSSGTSIILRRKSEITMPISCHIRPVPRSDLAWRDQPWQPLSLSLDSSRPWSRHGVLFKPGADGATPIRPSFFSAGPIEF